MHFAGLKFCDGGTPNSAQKLSSPENSWVARLALPDADAGGFGRELQPQQQLPLLFGLFCQQRRRPHLGAHVDGQPDDADRAALVVAKTSPRSCTGRTVPSCSITRYSISIGASPFSALMNSFR